MMDIFAKESFIRLANVDQTPCISIYIPTHRGGHEVNEGQDVLLYKNTLKEVEGKLQDRGLKPAKIKGLLSQAYEIMEDGAFWRHQSDTLAVFIAPDFYMHYALPITCKKTVTINNHLYITPLLPLLLAHEYYYILQLAKGGVKLYEATPYTITDIIIDDLVPQNISETLRFDDPEESIQHHTATGGGGAIFHGHGGTKDAETENLRRYLSQVDKGINGLLIQEHAPLVLAGDKNVVGEFKKISHHKHIMDEIVQGNMEHVPITELHELTRPIVSPYIKEQVSIARERFNNLSNTASVSSDIKEVILASYMKRIDTLLIKKDTEIWGDVDLKEQRVHMHTGRFGMELVNQAAVQTILGGGQVFLMNGNMPVKNAVAAIYRYDIPPNTPNS